MLDSKRVGTRLILTEFGFRLRAAFVILSDALAESNCEAAPKAESKRLYAQNDRFIFFQSYSVTEPNIKIMRPLEFFMSFKRAFFVEYLLFAFRRASAFDRSVTSEAGESSYR